MSRYSLLIEQIITTCTQKNATAFASLFGENSEIQLNSKTTISKNDLEAITYQYFTSLKYIKIDIINLAINEQEHLAFIEWLWSDYNLNTNTKNSYQNTIVLQFKNDLIDRWREYNLHSAGKRD